jgi:hypothetical protein
VEHLAQHVQLTQPAAAAAAAAAASDFIRNNIQDIMLVEERRCAGAADHPFKP